MRNKILILLFTCIINASFSQISIDDASKQVAQGISIPQESVFISFNSNLLLTGEYFYYSVYCFNNNSKHLSEISKVAYVELIGKDESIIFKHKINLEKGKGYSDFFIPVNVASGNYKLIAYTSLMINTNAMFVADINIINPYITNKKTYLTSIKSSDTVSGELFENKLIYRENTLKEDKIEDSVQLSLNSNSFKKREKVSVMVNTEDENINLKGVYSISVRKKVNFNIPQKKWDEFSNVINGNNFIKISNLSGNKVSLPELRGELYSGIVNSKSNNLPVNNLKIAISIPGDEYVFKIVETNKDGEFFVNLDSFYTGDKMYLQVLGFDKDAYEVKLLNYQSVNKSNLQFNDFKINPLWKEEILEQSIHNQIESAYFKFKPDSLLINKTEKLFQNRQVEAYNLDDYTRFSTLKETINEIVKNISIKKVDNEEYVFALQALNFGTNTGVKPLVFIDGIMIQNSTKLLNFNAYDIEKINVYRDRFVFGLEVFQGAIEIKTIKGFDDLYLDSFVNVLEIFKPQIKKKYFYQIYNSETINSRIPDDRQQLLWIPQFSIIEKQAKYDFYTSDVNGEFEIVLKGFTEDGLPILLSKTFLVDE
jgi:hypothetical protein